MKFLIIFLIASSAIAYTIAQKDFGSKLNHDSHRENEPQGSVVLRGEKPLSGPDQRATINLDLQRKLNEHTNVYGGGHYMQGDRVRPHAGVVYEREFGNGFINGRGQVQPGARGRLEPSFGINGGFRFRREADPQGSVVLRGEKPLSGPDQRATINLELQRKLNEHTSVYGGGHYMQGDRVRPHAGVVYEREFGNGFINGRGQVQPGARGRLEPSFGINGGFRFRREADPQGSVVLRGEKPLSGPDQRATINLELQRKLNEHTSVYGGGHYMQGDRVRPHAGVVYEREFGNGFINGRGQVQPGARGRLEPSFGINGGFRFRREADPQGSVVLRGEKPLSGPDQRATINLELQRKLNEHTSVYGGGHYMQGDRVRPHAGVVYEREFGNGFINGRGQVQPGARGRLEPSFGINGGFRFRREADPQGSVVLRGEKPLSGPDQRATINLELQRKLNEHTSVYGGGHYMQGDRVRPHAGVVYEREFGNGFINGRGQVQPGARGRLEPSFGINGGFRFRREADPQGSVVLRGEKPLSGPDQRATINLELQRKLNEHTSVYGGGHYMQGDRVRPHAGVVYEREFGNGFINGRGQVQPGARGRLEPSFGINGGFRFKRDAEEEEIQESEE
uniref:uncharacterized protein LOC127072214 isoform X2 n=1 Tax=Vespula vulgaris TaxID=7454 RepID=UPI00223BFC98|nr:uncharacterized protein LOC127072214 isoform X2 [Vespula vulgaris]